jgi:hypothetical protein
MACSDSTDNLDLAIMVLHLAILHLNILCLTIVMISIPGRPDSTPSGDIADPDIAGGKFEGVVTVTVTVTVREDVVDVASRKTTEGTPSEMVVTLQASPGFATEKMTSSGGGDSAAPTTSYLVSSYIGSRFMYVLYKYIL